MPIIRPIHKDELAVCTELFIRVFSVPPWNEEWPSLEAAQRYLQDYVDAPGFRGFVAVEGASLIAFLFGHLRNWWLGPELHIDELGVDPRWQGKRVGTMLIDHLKHILPQSGVHTITLLTRAHAPAAAFYEKQGFVTHPDMAFMSHRIPGGHIE